MHMPILSLRITWNKENTGRVHTNLRESQVIFELKDTEIKDKNQDQAYLLGRAIQSQCSLQSTAWTNVDSCMDEQKSIRQWGLTTKPQEPEHMTLS